MGYNCLPIDRDTARCLPVLGGLPNPQKAITMFKNAPLPLIVILAIYLPVELALTITSRNWLSLLIIALVVVLFFFAVRGSRIASIIWGIISMLGALGTAHMAIQHMRLEPNVALAMALYCVFFLASAGYLFFSPGLRRFYARPTGSG